MTPFGGRAGLASICNLGWLALFNYSGLQVKRARSEAVNVSERYAVATVGAEVSGFRMGGKAVSPPGGGVADAHCPYPNYIGALGHWGIGERGNPPCYVRSYRPFRAFGGRSPCLRR